MKKFFFALVAIALIVILPTCSFYPQIRQYFTSIRNTGDFSGRYESMTSGELLKLSDEEFCEAVKVRAEKKFYKNGAGNAIFSSMREAEKLILTLSLFELEFANGGLGQYYFNSSNVTASYLSDSLGMIGAEDHKRIYDDFVRENKINYAFLCDIADAYSYDFGKFITLYTFNEFDERFASIPDFMALFDAFIINNKEIFAI